MGLTGSATVSATVSASAAAAVTFGVAHHRTGEHHARLIIANEKEDELTGSLGEQQLRGKVVHDGSALPVQVIVTLGLLGTKYKLLVDGREHPIQRLE